MELPGAPRSIAEMEFLAGMYPCEVCGDRRPVELTTGGSGEVWIVRGTCLRCSTERRFVFTTDEDLFSVDQPDLELGLAEPSRVIGPHALIGEIDRLVPAIVADPQRLDDPAWTANSDVVDRVRTALNELAKFIPSGELAMPIDAHRDPAGVVDQKARPERYTRAWIDDERARWTVVAALIAQDAPRIFAADAILSRATPPRGGIHKDSLAAHREWLARGRSGEGRLDVVTTDAEEVSLVSVQMTAAHLEGVVLRRADLREAWLDDAELVDVDLGDAKLNGASLTGVALNNCKLDGAILSSAKLENAVAIGGSFERARLDHTRWHDAVVESVSFRGAVFHHARLDGARFHACDFRGVDFTGSDFTRTALVGCAFAGAYGAPSAAAGLSVVDADFSEIADGTDLGGIEDLLVELAD
jgi:uncharacterized protein YjbI with pentapeptide repeats